MSQSKSQHQYHQTFKQAQLSLGLSKQFYDAKFVYQQQQTSNPQAYLLPAFKQLPSQLQHFTQETIQIIHALAGDIMDQIARALQVPICTLILAKTIFHFFYARKSFLQYDIRDVIIGALYLACKSEETLVSGYQIAVAFDYVIKVYEGEKQLIPLQTDSQEYEYITKKIIPKVQLDILFQLGFQIYRLFNLPHRYIATLLSLFDKHPKYPLICQQAWRNLNDCYQSTVCLYYTPQMIGTAAVYMSMRQCNANFPQIPWWTLMQSYQQTLQNIEVMVKNLQKLKNKIKLKQIALIINQIGQSHGIQLAFPIPYSRKLINEKTQKQKIKTSLYPSPTSTTFQPKTITKKQPKTNSTTTTTTTNTKNNHLPTHKDTKPENLSQKKINTNQLLILQPPQQKYLPINKKNLFANINQSLQKHQAAIHAVKNKIKEKNQSSSQSQDQLVIAQLRSKILKNKYQHKNEQNK